MRVVATALIFSLAAGIAVAEEPLFRFSFDWVTEDDLRREGEPRPPMIELEIGGSDSFRPEVPVRPLPPESDPPRFGDAPLGDDSGFSNPPAFRTDPLGEPRRVNPPGGGDDLGNSVDDLAMPTDATELAEAPTEGPDMPDAAFPEGTAGDDATRNSNGELSERERAFADMMTNAVMTGAFTVEGKEDRVPKSERYEIASAKKLSGSKWAITARIKYGEKDFNLPIVVDVFWADDTPMISLTDLTIPGMGTFSARVLFHGDRYAGTWQHDNVGGHMFGKIGPAEQQLPMPGGESN